MGDARLDDVQAEVERLRRMVADLKSGAAVAQVVAACDAIKAENLILRERLARRDRALEWLSMVLAEGTGECPFSMEFDDIAPQPCLMVDRGKECRDYKESWRCWVETALDMAGEGKADGS